MKPEWKKCSGENERTQEAHRSTAHYILLSYYPKTPWDVMGCQVATCLEALFGVSRLEGLVFP